MDLNLDARRLLDDDNLALLKAENDRLSASVFSLQRELEQKSAIILDLKAQISQKEKAELVGEAEIVASLKARISQLEKEVERGYAEEVAKQRDAIEEEVRRDYDKRLADQEGTIRSLKEQVAAFEEEKAKMEAALRSANTGKVNSEATAENQRSRLYHHTAEQSRILSNRDPKELEALANLSFDGNELSGLTPDQAAIVQALRKNKRKSALKYQMAAKDSKELKALLEERMRIEEERKRLRRERNKSTQQKRAQFGGLDAASVDRRIKDLLKRTFPWVDPSLIHIKCYSHENPLPENVTIVRDHGGPDYTYDYTISMEHPRIRVDVVECVRVKARKSSMLEEDEDSTAKPSDNPADCSGTPDKDKEVGNKALTPRIEFTEAGFATVPCAPLPVPRALYTTHFDSTLLANILIEKYVHCSTLDSIIARMSMRGVTPPDSTFSEGLHRTLSIIRLGLEDFFLEKLRLEPHINIDETVQTVGVMEEVPQPKPGEEGTAQPSEDPPGGEMAQSPEGGPPEDVQYEEVAPEEVAEPAAMTIVNPAQEADKASELASLALPAMNCALRRHYRHKYLWGFYARFGRIVYYRYSNGSRAAYVLVEVLTNDFKGSITTDCYVVYISVGDKILPLALRNCCWVHMRRYVVEAMIVAPDECAVLLDLILSLFSIEALMNLTEMTPDEKLSYRAEHAVPKLNEFFSYIDLYRADPSLMAYTNMAKALDYAQNNKTELLNYLKDGHMSIDNNRVEAAFKIVKKMMRVSLNIGSERAAMNHAFLISLFETAKLWKLNMEEYLPAVFEAFNRGPKLVLDKNKTEQEQEEEIRKWKEEIRPFVEDVLPWKYVKNS